MAQVQQPKYNRNEKDGFLAQLAIYDGKGLFESSINYQGSVVSISLPRASKSDVGIIEKYLLQLIK